MLLYIVIVMQQFEQFAIWETVLEDLNMVDVKPKSEQDF